MPWFKGARARGRVKIEPTYREQGDSTQPNPPPKGTEPTGAVVWWNPNDRSELWNDPGVYSHPCGDLYHELVHAKDWETGTHDTSRCPNGLSYNEAKATLYENEFRRFHYTGVGLSARTGYGEEIRGSGKIFYPLPTGASVDAALETCKPKEPPKPPPKDPSWLDRIKGWFGRDPHLRTFDNASYSFQAVGEFVMIKSGIDFEVQTRQAPMPDHPDRTVSMVSAAAMRVGADRLGFYLRGDELVLHVNGQVESVTKKGRKLPGGGTIAKLPVNHPTAPDGYRIDWTDGSAAEINTWGPWGMNMFVYPADKFKGRLTGLMGDFDGNAGNDLKTRDGKQIAQPPQFEQLYRTFGDSWRIAQSESLFDYSPGESTEKFTDRGFPDRPITIQDLSENQREQARWVCQAAGVTDPVLLDECILDVALTAQPAFAVMTNHTQAALPAKLEEPSPGPVNQQRTLRDGDTVSGKLDVPGEQDSYRIDLGEAKEFQIVDVTGSASVVPEAGAWTRGVTADAWRFTGESKQLVASKPDNTTGDYGFRIVTQKPRRFDIKIGDRIGKGGVPGMGRLDVPGRVDVYVMDAAGTASIELTGTRGCDYWVGVAEDRPDATISSPYPMWRNGPDNSCTTIPIPLPVERDERFQLIVWSSEAKTLDYEFRVEPRG